MKNAFTSYITDNQLIKSNQKTLLAVSGGIDSVALCYLFKQANLQFGIAHCNFKLRKNASDEDESFVKNLAQNLAVPFFSIDFATNETSKNGSNLFKSWPVICGMNGWKKLERKISLITSPQRII
jgi:tRNA(Ile)-lysidine synthase